MQEKEELTLDPENWDELKTLGHQMVDDMMHYLASVRDRPVWRQPPTETVETLRESLPTAPQGFEPTYQAFRKHVLPYPNGNTHPRFWGWVQGTGTPYAMLADMLASGMNPHMAGFNQSPALVEETVIDWLKELMGFPKEASGLLTSGGTMANLNGLVVARNHQAGFDFRKEGFQKGAKMTVYASSETHKWAKESMEVLGFGSGLFRQIEVDEEFMIDCGKLNAAIQADRANGFQPTCIIANCGTVNTGAIDDLNALAKIAKTEKLWLHVDGAFGALARLSRKYSHLVDGLEKADSLAFDLHKWMYLPFEAGCILVRKKDAQRSAFSTEGASYLAASDRGVSVGRLKFSDLGIELTRGFKALKIWMSFKAHGTDVFRELIEQNIDQCAYLSSLIGKSKSLKLMAPARLNIVCFRFEHNGLDEAKLDAINHEILLRLQESGAAVPSATKIGGKFVLRVANVNHRTKKSDFDFLVQEVERIGGLLA